LFAKRDSAPWKELEDLLSLGGTFTTTRGGRAGRREFCAPYTYSAYPKPPPRHLTGETDPWVVLGDNVLVRLQRSTAAPIIGRLSYNIIPAVGGFDPDPKTGARWVAVELPNDREGWVLAEHIRDPEDYRACFAFVAGRWEMTLLERGVVFDKR
jgi:hypothetical protein